MAAVQPVSLETNYVVRLAAWSQEIQYIEKWCAKTMKNCQNFRDQMFYNSIINDILVNQQ